MTTRRQKLVVALISWLPVLVLICASAFYVVGQYRRVVNNASTILVGELERRLNREVKIGKATVTPLGTVVLDDIAIASGKKLTGGSIVRARQVRISYDVRALLLRNMGAQSVKNVLVIDPKVNLVRRRDGTLNVLELLKRPPGPPGKPFIGTVTVRSGSLVFRDYLAKTRPLPAMNRIFDLNGSLSAASQPVYKFYGTARGVKGRFAIASVIGSYNSRTKVTGLDLKAAGVNAAYLSRYVGLHKSIDVRGGTMNVIAGVHLAKSAGKTKMTLSGAAHITNAVAQLSIMTRPVTGISGVAVLKGQSAILSMTGKLGNSPVRAAGTIERFTNPKLDISASSPNADFAVLQSAFKLPAKASELQAGGQGPVKARITGTPSSPRIALAARVPRVVTHGYTAENVDISAVYADHTISIPSIAFTWRGAQVTASGSVSTIDKQNISIRGRAAGINIASLPLPSGMPAKGTARAGFSITGNVADPTIRAGISIVNGEFQGIPIETARARVRYSSGRIEVSALEVASKAAAGLITAKGAVTTQSINLSVTGESVNLARVGRLFGYPSVTGTGYFSGTIKGSINAPRFTGVFEAFNAGYDKYRADYVRLDFSTDMKTARVTSGIVRLFPAEFKFSGSANGIGTNRIAFKTSGQVDRLTIEKLAEISGRKIDISGTLVGSFDASGVYITNPKLGQIPLQDAAAKAQFTLEDGSAFGYPINEASVRLDMSGNKLEITEAALTSQEAKATAGGSVLLDTGAVNLTFGVSDFDMARLHDKIGGYAVIGGKAHALGAVDGSITNPKITLDAGIDDLIVNSIKFDKAQLKAVYSDGLVESASGVLGRDSQSISLQVDGYNIHTNCLASAKGSVENVMIADLWSMLRSSPYLRSEDGKRLRESLSRMPRLSSGSISGTFSLSGCMSSPEGSVHLAASDVGVETRRIESILLDASTSGGIVNLNRFQVTSGLASLIASGNYVIAERKVQLDISAANLDISRFSPWIGENTLGGTVAADFVINGDIGSPSVTGSVEVMRPSFKGRTFDALRASRIEITSDKIEFADVILASGSHQVVARGHLPWDWSTLSVPQDKPIEMVAQLNRQNLSVLSSFSNMVEPVGTEGSVEAMLQVDGTINNPVLAGSLTIQNGKVALKNFSNQFNDINVNVSFDGNRVVVNQFSIASSLGGTLSIVPGGYVAIGPGGAAQTNLQIAANAFSVAETNALGMQEDVSLQFDAGLSVTGDPKAPLITNANVGGVAGGISIHDSRIAFVAPTVPKSPMLVTPAINPTFNVAVNIGQNVVLAPPTMTLMVTGNGQISGNLARPVVVFDPITIAEGTLRLAVSRLTVAPGGTLYMRYAPPEEPILRVNLKATTNVTAMDSLGRRQRYEITMTVSGPVTNLDINLSSDPSGLSKEQMLAALGHVSGIFATGESGLQNELGNILTAVGTSTIFAPVESLFVEQLGFEQFTLEYALGQPLALYVSRRLAGNLYISYYGYLTSNFADPNNVAYLLGLSYRINPNYQASVFVDNQQNGSFQIQYTRAFW